MLALVVCFSALFCIFVGMEKMGEGGDEEVRSGCGDGEGSSRLHVCPQ